MPKGTHGCWICGAPTTHVLQIWLRDYREGHIVNSRRKEHTISSVGRSLCTVCADHQWLAVTRPLARVGGYHGCGYCGVRSTSRVQVWLRLRSGKSVRVKATSFCEECSYTAWDVATAPMGADDYRYDTAPRPPAGNLAAARARLTHPTPHAA
jgi:hypothetical protein